MLEVSVERQETLEEDQHLQEYQLNPQEEQEPDLHDQQGQDRIVEEAESGDPALSQDQAQHQPRDQLSDRPQGQEEVLAAASSSSLLESSTASLTSLSLPTSGSSATHVPTTSAAPEGAQRAAGEEPRAQQAQRQPDEKVKETEERRMTAKALEPQPQQPPPAASEEEAKKKKTTMTTTTTTTSSKPTAGGVEPSRPSRSLTNMLRTARDSDASDGETPAAKKKKRLADDHVNTNNSDVLQPPQQQQQQTPTSTPAATPKNVAVVAPVQAVVQAPLTPPLKPLNAEPILEAVREKSPTADTASMKSSGVEPRTGTPVAEPEPSKPTPKEFERRKKNASLSAQKTQAEEPGLDFRADFKPPKPPVPREVEENSVDQDLKAAEQILKTFKFVDPETKEERMYDIGAPIASGGFSRVFFSNRTDDKKKKYALKMVRLVRDSTMKPQLIYEVEVLRKLSNNPYTVGLLDGGVYDDSILFMILELGKDTFIDFLCAYQRHRTDIEHYFIRRYFRQMVRACEYIHYFDYVHCDIKGDNFIRMPNGRLKLVDFGCAARIGPLGDGVYRTRRLGTKYYMSPEYVKYSYASRALDVWSLGCILYDMIFERTPFDHAKNIKQAIVDEEPDLTGLVDEGIISLFLNMFERRHTDRISCRALVKEHYMTRRSDPTATIPLVRRGNTEDQSDASVVDGPAP